jgi:hypothetical protein
MPPFRVALFLGCGLFDLRMIAFPEHAHTIAASAVLNRARNFAVMDGGDVDL